MEKMIPIWLLALVVLIGVNLTVLFGWAVKLALVEDPPLDNYQSITLSIASFPSLVIEAFYETGLLKYKPVEDSQESSAVGQDHPAHPPLLAINRFPEIDGFSKNGMYQEGASLDDGYLLLPYYDFNKGQTIVKLLRISDQKVLHQWQPDIGKLQKLHDETANPLEDETLWRNLRYRIYHPLMLDDGGLVFNSVWGPLYKIDGCSVVEWAIDRQFHHSIELSGDGAFWVPLRLTQPSYGENIFKGYKDDAISKISLDGEVLFTKSVSRILDENGYRGLLFGAGPYEADPVHLNDIQPATSSTEFWEKDDLLLSLRHRSTVLLYRPVTNKVIWLKTGPWLNQHDGNFVGSSKISIFGNDNLRTQTDTEGVIIGGHNEIYVFDFSSGLLTTPFSKILNELDVRTAAEGRLKLLQNQEALVEETRHGRILRISRYAGIWEFVEKVDSQLVSMPQWSRYLTEEQVRLVLPKLEALSCS